MNFKKKLWLGSSILALMSHGPIAMAIDSDITWQARQLEEVLEEIVVTEENELSYTVKYGDTLSVISEAMNIESRYLAEINNIENVDLIFPETVLTAQYDANDRASNLTVDAPNGDTLEVSIPVNLSEIPEVEEVAPEAMPEAETETEVVEEAPVEEVVVPEETVTETGSETEVPVGGAAASNTIIEEVPAWVEEEPAVEAPVEEAPVETEVVEEAPVVEAAAYTEAPATEVPAETAPVYEEPVYEEVPVEEAPIEEAPIEAAPVEEVPVEAPVYEEPTYETDLTVDENSQAWEPVEEETPVVDEPVYEEPEEPVYEEPVYEEPVYEEPATDPAANPENAGLQPHAAAYKEEVAAIYGIDSFSLYRPGDAQDHGAGLAVDFMVPVGSQVGDDIANYSINSMAENDISYVIWEQQIYGDWNQQWTAMEDRGSITANHYDHVHVSFNPAY